jgi:hypothetical protein
VVMDLHSTAPGPAGCTPPAVKNSFVSGFTRTPLSLLADASGLESNSSEDGITINPIGIEDSNLLVPLLTPFADAEGNTTPAVKPRFGAGSKTPPAPAVPPKFERTSKDQFKLKRKEKNTLFAMAIGMAEFEGVLTKEPFKDASQQSKKAFTPTLKEMRAEIVRRSYYLVLEKDIRIVFVSTKAKIPKPSQWKLPMVMAWLSDPVHSILSDQGKMKFAIITSPPCLRMILLQISFRLCLAAIIH